MTAKRRRSSASSSLHVAKKTRTLHPSDHLSVLSSELLIRILHHLPINTLLRVQQLSHRFYTLAEDSQVWKSLYYDRFVLPRALRIPGLKPTSSLEKDERLHFSSRRSKWLDEDVLVQGKGGKSTNWKKQYKLRHNWSIGACEVQEIHVADRPSVPEMLVRLAEGVVVTADQNDGLRAWDLKEKKLIASCMLGEGVTTCLAVDEKDGAMGIAVGFEDGGWGTWRLETSTKSFSEVYRHPASSNGSLGSVAYAYPYILTITDAQLLSLYTFEPKPMPVDVNNEGLDFEAVSHTEPESELPTLETTSEPKDEVTNLTLIASLKSHTSWPPLSLSIRTTRSTLIASIAYSLPTYLSGYTIGLQELHLSLTSGLITFSRLASSLPQGFSSLLSPSSSSSPSSITSTTPTTPTTRPNRNSRPTSLSYAHPYILATHPDNTLTLYLCVSNHSSLTISSGTKLWGHTSSVSSAEITPRGKAVSVSTRGNELRVWELEGGGSARKRMAREGGEGSVRVRPEVRSSDDDEGEREREELGIEKYGEEISARKQWVGFDDEVVIVLKESRRGTQALMVYDFT